MGHRRRHPRISNTEDLSATLKCPGSISVAGRVLNLSEGGMLVAGSGLDVGDTAGFQLAGLGFRHAGRARVTHNTDGALGVRFLSWQGPTHRPIGALIAARLRRELGSGAAGRRDPRVLGRVATLIGAHRTLAAAPARRKPVT